MKYTDNEKKTKTKNKNKKTLILQEGSPSVPINHITKSVKRKQIVWLKFNLQTLSRKCLGLIEIPKVNRSKDNEDGILIN